MIEQNENQAEKHSAEPWSVGMVRCNMIFGAENNLVAELDKVGVHIAVANAARIVACVNYCARVSTTLLEISSSSTPLKDLLEDEVKLTAELSTLRKELEAAKKAHWWIENHITVENSIQILPMKAIHELRELLNNGKDGK